MYRGELPGFYWDGEKRKYFRVQANHYAVAPANAKYTKEKVDQIKRDDKKRKRKTQRENVRKRTLIQRVPELEHPSIARIGTFSELGQERNHHQRIMNERSRAYVSAMKSESVLNLRDSHGLYGVDEYGWEISELAWDSATKSVVWGAQNHDGIAAVTLAQRNSDDNTSRKFAIEKCRPVTHFPSPVSSVNMNPKTRTLVMTTTGDKTPPIVHISQVQDPIPTNENVYIMDGACCSFKPHNVTTIFTSASNPWLSSSGQETIAIGTSHEVGIQVLTAHDANIYSRDWRLGKDYKTYSDVLAVDWLSPHLLAAGLRDASVILYDIRSQSGIKRMKHSGGIMNLKRADNGKRFVVAGMGGKMAMYDLRALRTQDALPRPQNTQTTPSGSKSRLAPIPGLLPGWSTGFPKPKSKFHMRPKHETERIKTSAFTSLMQPAQPVVTFQYENQYDYMLGMDVSTELGVVVAAENGGRVRASSLMTGKTVKTWQIGKETEKVTSLRVVDDADGVPTVLAGCGHKIYELGLAETKSDVW